MNSGGDFEYITFLFSDLDITVYPFLLLTKYKTLGLFKNRTHIRNHRDENC